MTLGDYRAPAWLPGGHAQTIWAALRAQRHAGPPPPLRRERWTTPDGDFIDVDHLQRSDAFPPAQTPAPSSEPAPAPQALQQQRAGAPPLQTPKQAPQQHLVLFHGLEGSSGSAYAQAFASLARARGWAFSVPHFRGCSGELNRAPRAYHSGDFEEVGWILQRLRLQASAPLLVVGISLGGNALLRWAQEAGDSARATAAAVAAVCSPIDLTAAGLAIDSGLNRILYARMFLASMKPRALAKLRQHPGLFDEQRLRAARTLYEFDDVFTAPLHGFADTADYWSRASALPHLQRLRLPALLLNAANDPFVPVASLPRLSANPLVTLWQPAQGGHVGFPQGRYPAQVTHMPQAVCDWLASALR